MNGLIGFAFTVALLGSCVNGQLLFSSMAVGFKEFADMASGLNSLSRSTKIYYTAMYRYNATWKSTVVATMDHMIETFELMKANTDDSAVISKINSYQDMKDLEWNIHEAEKLFTDHIQTLSGDIRRQAMVAIQAVDEGYETLDALTATSTSPNAQTCFDQTESEINGNVSLSRLALCIDTEIGYTNLVGGRIGVLFNQAKPDFIAMNDQQGLCSSKIGKCFTETYIQDLWDEKWTAIESLMYARDVISNGLENSHWRITECLARTIEDIRERFGDLSSKLQTCLAQ